MAERPVNSSASVPLNFLRWLVAPLRTRRYNVANSLCARGEFYDKTGKVIVYTCRLLAWKLTQELQEGKAPTETIKLLTSLNKKIGGTRKVIRLGKWLYSAPNARSDWRELNGDQALSTYDTAKTCWELSNDSLGLLTDMCDDINYLRGLVGAERLPLPTPLVQAAAEYGDTLWWLTTFLDLGLCVEGYAKASSGIAKIEQQMRANPDGDQDAARAKLKTLRRKRIKQAAGIVRFSADVVASSIGQFDITASPSVKLVCGLVSGVTGWYQVWHKGVDAYTKLHGEK